ncbi:MAG TPA: hypothetical protein VLM40_19910 [Gemmata sp.]|nr:hypothetical protein [Gemmata sp.]
MSPRWRLVLASAAFLAWMGYLGYAAITKSRAPTVSHIQAAAADAAVVAELTDGPTAVVDVVETLWGDVPQGRLEILNLATPPGDAPPRGFAGPGKYLLLLKRHGDVWAIVGPQRSPGDPVDPSVVMIYPWSEDVRRQVESLRGGQ